MVLKFLNLRKFYKPKSLEDSESLEKLYTFRFDAEEAPKSAQPSSEEMSRNAIIVRGAEKSYGKNLPPILDGLNMTVPRGSIYGLLGASGCGKTTLLSCIVGVMKIDDGDIWVLGGKPGHKGSGVPGPRVGYMPQEISLVQEFSVIGAIYYFGRINGLEDEEIDERYEFFSQLLELPPKDRFVKHMSGGQQRRVSFAAALIHKPELLILDEPTVGLDPILREKIWNFLVKITQEENVAVIITTHYIEEAKMANRIGLMRQGVLLAETTPQSLLAKCKCSSLEEAFLYLSKKQNIECKRNLTAVVTSIMNIGQFNEEPVNFHDTSDYDQPSTDKHLIDSQKSVRPKRSANPFTTTSAKIFKALLIKNILQFVRHPGGVLFAFIFPFVQTTLFYYAVGNDPKGIVMGVVNHEAGNCQDGNMLGSVIYLKEQKKCDYVNISCRFLHGFNESIMIKRYYDTLEEATEDVRKGKTSGTMYFAHNFSKALVKRYFNPYKKSQADLVASEVATSLDMGDSQIGLFLMKRLFERFIEIHKDVVAACNIPRKFVQPPFTIEEPIFGSMDRKYSNFIAPGFILSLTFFLATSVSASIIIADRSEGVWNRSLVQGVTTWEILFSHMLTQLTMIMIQVTVVVMITFVYFDLPCEGSFIALVALIFLDGMSGMIYGFLISVYCNSQTIANFLAVGSFYPLVLLSGAIWPLEGMHESVRWLSYTVPTTTATYSLRCLMEKGYGFTHPDVYKGFITLNTWTLGFVVLCLIGIKNKTV